MEVMIYLYHKAKALKMAIGKRNTHVTYFLNTGLFLTAKTLMKIELALITTWHRQRKIKNEYLKSIVCLQCLNVCMQVFALPFISHVGLHVCNIKSNQRGALNRKSILKLYNRLLLYLSLIHIQMCIRDRYIVLFLQT